MAILLERNAEQTVSLKGSKLDLSSYRDLRKVDEAADGEKKPSQKEETGKIHEDSLTVVREYEGNQGNAIACSDEGQESSSIKGFDELNASMEGHTISDPSMHVYTGFPAYGPYLPPTVPPAETVYYHNLAVDYSYVHMQAPYGCTMPTGVQYMPPSNGYVPVYPYDFYQIPPPFGQYAAPYTGYVSTDQQQVPMMLPGPNTGYALEMAPSSDTLMSQSGFSPYYPQRSLSASAPVWMNMDAETAKETDGEYLSEELKEAAQAEGVEVSTNPCPSSPIQHDTKTKGFSENSKKQQYRRAVMHSGPVLSKKAWPAQLGAWQYVAVSPSPSTSLKLVPKSLQVRADSNSITLPNAKLAVAHETDLSDSSLDLANAKHFVIKSFSEENVYRSIEHSVWASTPSGNHKLNVVFQDIQQRTQGKPSDDHRCPIFLYFSVNGSGRFCGVAEMVGPVEFKKTMEFWDRNKWCGSFPVKWHIIKDVPNSQLRRIILQNNENKPVTSSRDTQEIVNTKQGLEMLDIFKNYPTKASILDRFPELPSRQNMVNDDKEEVSGGDGDHPQASAMECNLIKRAEEISLNPSKAWNAGLEHTEDSYLLPKRKPLLPGKIANVDNVVVGKEAEKQNMVMVHRVDVKA